MNESWSDLEVELIVADYFSMLDDELKGTSINKTDHRKSLIALLNNRSHGSIEFKYQNISAALIEMGLPYISGYKPRYNYQRSKLIFSIEKFLQVNIKAEQLFLDFCNRVPDLNIPVEFDSWTVPPPTLKKTNKNKQLSRRPIIVNYLEKEQKNRILGFKGEELVIQYEQFSLEMAGKSSLANQVEWISKSVGDGLGFDILSKNLNGSDKFIEVKTTKLSKETPFFFSINEYNFSIENESNYYLYRIFDFELCPRMFELKGNYNQFCNIEPIQYKGTF